MRRREVTDPSRILKRVCLQAQVLILNQCDTTAAHWHHVCTCAHTRADESREIAAPPRRLRVACAHAHAHARVRPRSLTRWSSSSPPRGGDGPAHHRAAPHPTAYRVNQDSRETKSRACRGTLGEYFGMAYYRSETHPKGASRF